MQILFDVEHIDVIKIPIKLDRYKTLDTIVERIPLLNVFINLSKR